MNQETPWGDCKVAFGIEDPEPVWAANVKTWPEGWELCETDCTGARCVAVFRIEGGMPTIEDGEAVLRAIMTIEGKR